MNSLLKNRAFPWARQPLLVVCTCIGLLSFFGSATLHASEMATLQQLASNLQGPSNPARYTILVRHALAPGTGDPAEVVIDDCSTQRNLNQEGRTQAERIGKMLAQAGIEELEILTSQWCRCRETAKLVGSSLVSSITTGSGLVEVTDLPSLNSFFGAFENRDTQTEELLGWLRARAKSDADRLALLVTHQVNITAATDVYPASGEMVLIEMKDDGLEVVATVETL